MQIEPSILVLAGSLSLTVTLGLAWCLAGMRYLSSVLLAMSIGSLLNPSGFLALAIEPNLRQHPSSPFSVIMACSFVLTTLGYIGAAWYVARAAVLGP
jgi:hypothetical protein